MDDKQMNQYGILLDGKMDEPVWDTLPEHTNFVTPRNRGNKLYPEQTSFKVLSCDDRIYFGVKCMVPKEDMQWLTQSAKRSLQTFFASSIELFLSPSGTSFEYYQFMVSMTGNTGCNYYSEGGFIKPDKYAPEWNVATYIGEDYWSAEIELPLTAFYWTSDSRWNTTWLLNVARVHPLRGTDPNYSTWSPLDCNFHESTNFKSLEGFPVRPVRDDVCIISASVDLEEETKKGYRGVIKVETKNAVADEFVFSSNVADDFAVSLKEGNNEFVVPCEIEELGTKKVMLCLTRKEDGKVFKRYYPVRVIYDPIEINFILPEYRNNFYPGQDYSKIVGTVKASKAVTLKLEGPGIETKVLAPNADGSFTFETPNFEVGDAFLTATIDGYEIQKKIRRLVPSGHKMSWISGGNLIVDGKPVLRRDIYAQYYRGGEVFKKRFDADDLHITRIGGVNMEPRVIYPKAEAAGGEAMVDGPLSEEMRATIDRIMEQNKDRDYVYYYISDEPECRGLSPIYFKNMYEYIANKDPYHVILTATRNAAGSVDFADWFETHPYINPCIREDGSRFYERPINAIGKFVDDIVKLNRPDKCIGFLPTCFAYKWSSEYSDYPTFDEMICHTWAAMMRGGKTLWPYAYHDLNDRVGLYEGIRYIFTSFEALENLVLLGKRTTLTNTMETEAVLYDTGDEQMFVLVNKTLEPQSVTLDGLTGTWYSFRHNEMITGNSFDLKPNEVVIGTSCVKDKGLPTYQEELAIVEKAEYERTHGGSLLFERHREITVKGSNPNMCDYKLFDGVKDNWAWADQGSKEKFIELNLTKVKPTFNKVVVSGYNIDEMGIKIRNNSELTEPVIADMKVDGITTTFILTEPVSPDCLRLEFFREELVEVYELEVFVE